MKNLTIKDNPVILTKESLRDFQQEIWNFYKSNKRDLPWRNTTDPYYILVSEVMLQQTQVTRVIPKYQEFIKKFPTIEKLAQASKAEVLILWQGLGYNRRALFLKKTCETLFEYARSNTKQELFLNSKKISQRILPKTSKASLKSNKKAEFPTDREELLKLPGIGQSTAGALLAFAFNRPIPFIETNIRAVFIYFFFKNSSSVSDIHILELVQQSLNQKKQYENPREWYYALYDYGTMLKTKLGKKKKTELHKQSKHYNKQSTFKGSNREIRSTILKFCTASFSATKHSSKKHISGDKNSNNKPKQKHISKKSILEEILKKLPQANLKNIESNLDALKKEGFLQEVEGGLSYTLDVV